MGDVATQNLFALLGDEGEDPLANFSEAKPEKQEKKKPAAAPAEGRPGAGVAARLGGNNTSPQGGRGGAEGRGRGRGSARGRGSYDRPRQTDGPDASVEAENSNVSRGDNGYRGRGGGFRGRGRGGDDRRPARHEYERRDASGRGNEIEKKHGAGRGNWGDQREELTNLTDKPLEAVTGAPLAEAAEEAMVAAGGDPADGPTPEEEAEAEAKEMTLDEYEAMQKEKRSLNKPVEAPKVDLKQFEGMNVSQARKDKPQEEDAMDLKNRRGPKAQKEKTLKEKVTVEANFRVGEEGGFGGGGRGRGGRGGRGGRFEGGGGGYGGRGGRGDYGGRDQEATNGFRGGYSQGYGGRGGRGGGRGTNINVDDQSAFPTLG